MADDWSRTEVEAIVEDYLTMLEHQLRGRRYSKTEHRRALSRLLSGRNESSIEYKHRNISAVLEEVGYPFLSGYKPLSNYQGLLADVVLARLREDTRLEHVVASDAEEVPELTVPSVDEILRAFVAPPSPEKSRRPVRDARTHPYQLRVVQQGTNYLEREARNRDLGRAGEVFVVRFEQARLLHGGHERLAAQVEHVSRSRGDGLGYDVLSYEESGRERLIEVKTTKHGKETPFFVSQNEVSVSTMEAERYQLYRVFDFRKRAKLFSLAGSLRSTCDLEPNSYRARVA